MRIVGLDPDTVSPPMTGGYSHAVRVELSEVAIIYVSGQMAFDVEGTLVGVNDIGGRRGRSSRTSARSSRRTGPPSATS
jgi:enamine deaminase RidA (YjgF/YER057c/UK114 family)